MEETKVLILEEEGKLVLPRMIFKGKGYKVYDFAKIVQYNINT